MIKQWQCVTRMLTLLNEMRTIYVLDVEMRCFFGVALRGP
jgi:hypothetical protein